MIRTLKRSLGGALREAGVYISLVRQKRGRPLRVLMFPSQGLDDGAARLRAYAVAHELGRLGWLTAVCPKQLSLTARQRLVRFFEPSVIVMQTARHPLNRPRLFPDRCVVVDLDDADYVNAASAPAIIEALRDCAGVIAGSRAVANFCRMHNDNVTVVWTGTPPSASNIMPQLLRKRTVTWAASSPLGSPQEAAFLRGVLDELVRKKTDFVFRMYCDDNSAEFRDLLGRLIPASVRCETLPYMDYPAFLRSLDSVAVGLAPLVDLNGFSGGKSFGKVLAYLDRGVPVVTHPAVDHPLFFRQGVNGLMLDGVQAWADAIEELLNDPDRREAIAAAGRQSFLSRLAASTSARYVDEFLRETLLQGQLANAQQANDEIDRSPHFAADHGGDGHGPA